METNLDFNNSEEVAKSMARDVLNTRKCARCGEAFHISETVQVQYPSGKVRVCNVCKEKFDTRRKRKNKSVKINKDITISDIFDAERNDIFLDRLSKTNMITITDLDKARLIFEKIKFMHNNSPRDIKENIFEMVECMEQYYEKALKLNE